MGEVRTGRLRAGKWGVGAALVAVLLGGFAPVTAAENVRLAPADTPQGYLARLLVNEVPFPGERFWVSEEDSSSAQFAILWVLRNRLRHIPRGYTQRQVAAVTTDDVVDLLTAGGVHGQVEGFYRGPDGRPTMTSHVTERLAHLLAVANRGTPGKFARLLNHAQQLADGFVANAPADRFAALRELDGVAVTGSAYGWMTDRDIFRPGGNFVRIGDRWRGGMGGNRFFTLRQLR
jgi:hypothetical protein